MRTSAGRRLPDGSDIAVLERPGDYFLGWVIDASEGSETRRRALWFLLPIHEGETLYDRPTRGSGLHCIQEPPWSFRECDDGSIEVRASIACGRRDPEGEYWHGFLDEGHVWREI